METQDLSKKYEQVEEYIEMQNERRLASKDAWKITNRELLKVKEKRVWEKLQAMEKILIIEKNDLEKARYIYFWKVWQR